MPSRLWPGKLRTTPTAPGTLLGGQGLMVPSFSSGGRGKHWWSHPTAGSSEGPSVAGSTSPPTVFNLTSALCRRSINSEVSNMPGTLLHCDEAARFIEQIQDPVTKNLVNM